MTSQTPRLFDTEIGVDVAKHKLDIFDGAKLQTIPNTKPAISRWLKGLQKDSASLRVSCESTGTYGNTLIKCCLLQGVPVSLLTPSMVKAFIRSSGKLAKTDKIDACAIACFAGYHHPKCLGDEWLNLDGLKQIYRRIEALKQAKAKNKASLDQYDSASIKSDIRREIKSQEKRIQRFEKEIDAKIALMPGMLKRRQILESVKGVGRATSNGLLIHMPELGSLNRRQVSALAGLAPQHNESGMFKGRRMIRGGRKTIRKCLYMSALVTSRTNEMFCGFYQKLRAKGKAARVSIIAVARKLLIYLNTLLKNEMIRI